MGQCSTIEHIGQAAGTTSYFDLELITILLFYVLSSISPITDLSQFSNIFVKHFLNILFYAVKSLGLFVFP